MKRRKFLMTGLMLPLISTGKVLAALESKSRQEPRKPKKYNYVRVLFLGDGRLIIEETNSRAKCIVFEGIRLRLVDTRKYYDQILLIYK